MKDFVQTNNDIFKVTKYTEKMLSRKEAAHFLGVQKNTLTVWACTKRYKLPIYKVGRHIKYKLADLQNFIDENEVL